MNRTMMRPKVLSGVFAVMVAGLPLLPIAPALAQVNVEEQGTLQPMQGEHTFSGSAGDVVKISLNSDAFDTLLVLLDPSNQEIAFNDDYARSLNSTIVVTLPADGTYTALARSFSGQGGDYSLTVEPASEYDQAYAEGVQLYQAGDFAAAVTALTKAIEIDPQQPSAYLDRGEANFAQNNIDAAVADLEEAAKLFDAAGDSEQAQQVRDQIQFLQNPEFLENSGEEAP